MCVVCGHCKKGNSRLLSIWFDLLNSTVWGVNTNYRSELSFKRHTGCTGLFNSTNDQCLSSRWTPSSQFNKKKRGLFHEIKTVQISLRRLSLFVLWYWEWAPSFLCHHEWVKFLNRHLLVISWQKVELGLKSLNNVLLKPNEMDGWTMEGWNLIVLKDRTRHITCSLPLTGAVFCITLKLTDDLKEILCFFLNVTVVYNTYRHAWAERVIDDSPLFMTVMWWGSKPSVHLHLDLPQTTPISGSRHPFA